MQGKAIYIPDSGKGHVITDLVWFARLWNKCLETITKNRATGIKVETESEVESERALLERALHDMDVEGAGQQEVRMSHFW